jgi:uncharacterized protein YndB with AHSA1/START domain
MAALNTSVEIDRSPEDVFAYVADLSRHDEWQPQVQEITVQTEGPTRVGSRSRERRKPPHGPAMNATYEITEYEPPRRMSFRGVDGPVRVVGTATFEPSGDGVRVDLEIDLTGHGLVGKILAPIARRELRKQVPLDQQRLKERMEAGS